jgi:hypothetical protein
MSRVTDYVIGADRNNPDEARAHYYAYTAAGNLWPMCDFGWNRSGGNRFSIFRGHGSVRGTCRICERRMAAGLRPVIKPRPHKTKWL